jgi:hypothetical protein
MSVKFIPVAAFVHLIVLAIVNPANAQLTVRPPPGAEVAKAINLLPPNDQAPIKQARDETFPVFIFLPGVLGSKLTRTENGLKTVIWGDMKLRLRIRDFISRIDATLGYRENDVVEAEILDDFYIDTDAGHFGFNIYGHAYQSLKLMNLSNTDNILRFAYDWRQSNKNSAIAFQNWLCQPKQLEKIKNRPVVIIAHSMGGLVLKYWLKHFYENESCPGSDKFSGLMKIRKIMLVGTPNFGAPKALVALASEYSVFIDPSDNPFWLSAARIDAATLSRAVNKHGIYFPSAYELLPIVNTNDTCFRNPEWPKTVELHLTSGEAGKFDLFDATTWKELGWPRQLAGNSRLEFVQNRLPALLRSAKEFLCDVASFDVDAHFDVIRFFGDDRDTVCTVTIIQPVNSRMPFEIRVEPMCPGDGTVPRWIGRAEGQTLEERRRPAHDEHKKLVSNNDFLSYLRGFYGDLLNEFKQRAVKNSEGNVLPIANVFATVRYFPPSAPSEAGTDPVSQEVGNKVLEKLNLSQAFIYNAIRPVQSRADEVSSARAEGYRAFVDVADADPKRQLWALNNAAHIYLKNQDFVLAGELSKKAIEFADIPTKRDVFSENELSDLVAKAAVTAAISANKLGNKNEASFYRDLALKNHSQKARKLQLQ